MSVTHFVCTKLSSPGFFCLILLPTSGRDGDDIADFWKRSHFASWSEQIVLTSVYLDISLFILSLDYPVRAKILVLSTKPPTPSPHPIPPPVPPPRLALWAFISVMDRWTPPEICLLPSHPANSFHGLFEKGKQNMAHLCGAGGESGCGPPFSTRPGANAVNLCVASLLHMHAHSLRALQKCVGTCVCVWRYLWGRSMPTGSPVGGGSLSFGGVCVGGGLQSVEK